MSLLLSLNRKPKVEFKEKVVTKIQERVRTVTKIKVSPDGTKETTIDEVAEKDTVALKESSSKPSTKDWLIGTSVGIKESFQEKPDFGINVQRRIILDAYLGIQYVPGEPIRAVLTYAF